MEYGTVIVVVLVVALIAFFVFKKNSKPSQSDIISAKNDILSHFAVEQGDCEALIEEKQEWLKEISTAFSDIENGKNPVTLAKLQEGCEKYKQKAGEIRERIQKLRDLTIQEYNAALKVIEASSSYVKINDERISNPDDEIDEDDANTRDLIEKVLEQSQAKLPRLKEELSKLGYVPK